MATLNSLREEATLSYQFSENSWGERYIDSLNRQAFVPAPSASYFDDHMSIDFDRPDVMYIVTGSDSALFIRYMAERVTKVGTRIVFIEPDDIYNSLIQDCGDIISSDGSLLNNAGGTITLHSQSNWENEVFDGTDHTWFLGGDIELLESQACLTDYTQSYLPLYKEVRSAIDKRRFDVSAELGNQTFARTQIINATDNVLPLLSDLTFGQGHTAIVLGGGPSLDLHIEWVVENREKLFIVAISRLCEKLQSLNIKPDVVVSIDPYFYSYDVSKHGLLWDDVPLICGYHASPQLVQEWRGPKFFLGTRLPWISTKSEIALNTVAAGGPTVSHTAIVVAANLGFKQILMTGVDLCYSSVNTHSKDSPEAAFQSLPSLYDAQVETYNGQMAGTQYRMQRSVQSLEFLGKTINQHTSVLFNLSEHAAKIDCIPYTSTDDVLLPESKPSFEGHTEQYRNFDFLEDLHALQTNVTDAKTQYHLIVRSCQQAQQIIARMYKPSEAHKKGFYNAKLDKIDQRIEKRAADHMYSIKYYQSKDLTALQRPSGFDEMDESALEAWISDYYKIHSDGAKIYLSMIENVEYRLRLRINEFSGETSIGDLLNAWDADQTPGRIMTYSNNGWDDDIQALINKAQDAFIGTVNDTDTRLSRKLKSYNVDIDNCMRSLTFLYNIKNTTDLLSLSENLEGSTWPGDVLRSFALGLIDELDAQHESSIAHFQSIIDACSERLVDQSETLETMQRIIEESLVRMTQAYLSTNEPDQACSALGTLCEMLPQYIMSYAKLLNLCGNTDSSVELLSVYIENFPTHWQAAQLMSDILAGANRRDEADLAKTLSLSMRNNSAVSTTKKAA